MKIIKDIRFWILLFFLIRLFNITQAPLEVSHNWRQVTGNMVTRNFLEVDNNIVFPRLDFAGDASGIAGTEFPLMNYIHYGVSLVFGYGHWYGRLINLILASIGIFYFFKLIRRFFNQEIAFKAALILLVSLWFSFSRKSMPDIFSISLCLLGLYYGLRFLYDDSSFKNGCFYFLFGCLGILSKIPSAYIFILMLIPFLNKSIDLNKKIVIGLLSACLLAPSIWWYFFWVPHLTSTYGFDHYFMGDPILQGATEIFIHFDDTIKKFYAEAIGYFGFLMIFISVIFAILKRAKSVLIVSGLSFLSFLMIIFKSGHNFAHHSYYILPFVPVMALMLAWGLSQIKSKEAAYILLFFLAFENVANQQHDFFTKKSELHKLELEAILDQYSNEDDLIAISGSPNPQEMYFAHRKGWIFNESEVNDLEFVQRIRNGGCHLIVINRHHFDRCFYGFEMIYEDDDYRIFMVN